MSVYQETIEFTGDFSHLGKQFKGQGKKIEDGLKATFAKSLKRVVDLREAMARGTSGRDLFGKVGGLRAQLASPGGSGGTGALPGVSPVGAPKSSTPQGKGGKGASGGSGFGAGLVGGVVGGAVIAGVGALRDSFTELVTAADAAGNSKIFDVRTYGRLAAAAKKGNTDIGTLDTTASKLAHTLAQSKLPPEFSRGLQALGVSAKELKGLAPEAQFGLIADRIGDFKNPADQAAVAMKVFGESGTSLLPFLRQGSAGISAAADAAERYGAVITEDTVEATKRYKDSVDSLTLRLDGVKTQLGSAVIPLVADFAGWLGDIGTSVGPQVSAAMARVSEVFDSLMESGRAAGEAVGPILGGALELLGNAADRIQGTFEGLAEGFGLTGDSAGELVTWVGDVLVEAVGLADDTITGLYDALSPVVDIMGSLVGLVGDFGDFIGGDAGLIGLVGDLTDAAIGLVDDGLSYVQAVLETVVDLFDTFGEGTWEDSFLALGNALLQFILEPLRSIVSTVVTIADAISEDLVPDSVRQFAQGGEIRALAAEHSAEKKTRRQESQESRDAARREREQKKQAAAEEKQRAAEEKALGLIGPKEAEISRKRLDALKQTDAKLTGETLSLGARDTSGRLIELYLGAKGKTAAAFASRVKFQQAANAARGSVDTAAGAGLPLPWVAPTGRVPVHTPARVPTTLHPTSATISSTAAVAAMSARTENHFDIDIHITGDGGRAGPDFDYRKFRSEFTKMFRELLDSEVNRAQRLARQGAFLT